VIYGQPIACSFDEFYKAWTFHPDPKIDLAVMHIGSLLNHLLQIGKRVYYTSISFAGRGTTGIVSGLLGRNFTGIDLYQENVTRAKKNILNTIKRKISIKLQDQIQSTSKQNVPSLETYLISN
jgi:hypothetical protein